jgi:hypothetical protein
MTSHVTITARVSRKQPDLPRFVVIRAVDIADWHLEGTTVVEIRINQMDRDRRTLKRWTPETWFLTITERDCEVLGIDTGSKVTLQLRLASAELPEELAAVIALDREAKRRWETLTTAQKRMLSEEIAAAKQPATRERRARKALLGTK